MLISQTPLRISLAGGGTDLAAYYSEKPGAVLSSAIDKYVYVIVNPRFDDRIVLGYTRKEIVLDVNEIEHELIRAAMKKTGVGRGVEVVTMADIPSEGSGLGSSSSVTVGLLNALYAYRGTQVGPEQLAREACEIEIETCGKPIGKQDQYIAAYGGMRHIEFLPDESVQVEEVSLGRGARHKLSERMRLFYTNSVRKAEDILREQRDNTHSKRSSLDEIRSLVVPARRAVQDGNYDVLGQLLDENWRIKRGLAGGISNPEIDEMVERAQSGGATGCKVCGAGGGGFLLTYCPHGSEERLRQAMSGYREMPFFLERFGSKIIFNVEGYEWK